MGDFGGKPSRVTPSPTLPPAGGGRCRRFDSITALSREAWNQCFIGALEDYDYCLALERAAIPGFTLCYYALHDSDALLAAFPVFFTDYDLATTADGMVKSILSRIGAKLKLACVGSFATETALIAMHPQGTAQQKRQWFAQLLAFFKADAAAHKTKLLAFKDLNAANKTLFGELLAREKFTCVPGMPGAVSLIGFKSIEEYLAGLSAATRKDMRRKLKKQGDIRIAYTRDIEPHIESIYALYLQTRARSDLQFEELTRDYFREVAKSPNGLSSLYFRGETLIGCNLMLAGHGRLLDKFFCMGGDGQEHNLYFISWFANLQYCIDRGFTAYHSGQAGYETKLRLGSALEENWMYFHHRNGLANALLKLAAPLLAFDIPQTAVPALRASTMSTGTGGENK